LLTITSQEENDFISDNLLGAALGPKYWVGAFQDHSLLEYSEPAGGWSWITGEAWVYDNWETGEPNEWNNEGEDFINILTNVAVRGLWNDIRGDKARDGYIMEVPEPATISVMAIGALSLLRRRKK
jgi:hypothetical protein